MIPGAPVPRVRGPHPGLYHDTRSAGYRQKTADMLNLATIARPYFGAVVLTCALLTAGGIYSATRMPSGVYPEVTFPRIAVVARVPDWDVNRMEQKVTRPLED